MKTVAILSLKGGVGKTTTAANLGAALAQHDPSGVLLVDCDPRNQLGIHFGLGGDAKGLADASLRGASWARSVRDVSHAVTCLPFGALNQGELRDFEALVARSPDLLRDGLSDPALRGFDVAIIDCAPWPSSLLSTVLPIADVVVVVLLADPASFATLPSLGSLLRDHPRVSAQMLLNCVDGTRLATDVRAVVSALPNVSALPFVIHRDQAVPEALASQRSVLDAAPSSQAAADYRQLAEWVVDAVAAAPLDGESYRDESSEPTESVAGGATQ